MKKSKKMKIGFCLVVGIAAGALLITTGAFASSELKKTPVDTKSKYIMQVWDDTDWVAMPWYKELSAAFEEMYPNIKVQPVGISCSDLGPKLLTALAAGTPPDLPRSLYNLGELSARGALMDLTERVEHWSRKFDFISPLQLGQLEGKQYAIPQAHMPSGGTGYYWKADFEKVGLRFFEPDERVDWNQLMEVFEKLRAGFPERKDYYPTGIIASWVAGGAGSWLSQNGARYWSEDYETPIWDSPEAIKAFEWHANLYRKGYAPRPAPGFRDSSKAAEELFIRRKVSITHPCDVLLTRYLAIEAPELAGEENWGCFIPIAPGQKPVLSSWLYSSSIAAGAPHPEAAWAWIELMCTNWGMSRILRDSKYFPTMRGFRPEGLPKQLAKNYSATQPYVVMRHDVLSNYKYPGAMDIVQEMIEKMFYTNEDTAALAKEYKQKALEYIKERK